MELDTAIYSSWPLSAGGTRHEGHLGQLKSTEGARAMTLDSYIRDAKLKRIDIVKIDVDGYECDVFDGWQSFDDFRPTIVMELAPYVLTERNCSLQHIIERFKRAEYELCMLVSGKRLPLDATALDQLIGYGRGINVIARPRTGADQK